MNKKKKMKLPKEEDSSLKQYYSLKQYHFDGSTSGATITASPVFIGSGTNVSGYAWNGTTFTTAEYVKQKSVMDRLKEFIAGISYHPEFEGDSIYAIAYDDGKKYVIEVNVREVEDDRR